MSFFRDPGCTLGAASATIDAGTSFTSTWFRGANAGNFTLSISAPGLTGTSQLATFVTRPTLLVFNANPPGQLLAGTCFQGTVQTRTAGGGGAPVFSDTPVGLTEVPTDGTRYYSDAACTIPITAATILAGQSQANFFIKAITGGLVTVTAASPFGSAQQAFTIIPAVRRGTCAFTNWSGNLDCSYAPSQSNLSRTALIFQASVNSDDPDYMLITCELASNSRVHCARQADIPIGPSGTTVHWQTLELPAGLRVEQLKGSCNSPPVTRTIFTPVTPSSTFVLKSTAKSGGGLDDEELAAAVLTSPTTVTYDVGGPLCGTQHNYDLQLVELTGLAVTRGIFPDAGTLAAGATLTGLPAASANRAVLVQPRALGGALPICSRLIRAAAPTPTSISFTRGAGIADGGCQQPGLAELVWERIDFGTRATVQTITVTLAPGVSQQDAPISAVDLTRTVVLSSGQAASGQGSGETDSNVGTQFAGEALGRFELTAANNVRITRDHSVFTARFTFFVVQIEP